MGQVVETGTKACPYCSERIRAEAVKCRFCGEWFQDPTPPEAGRVPQSRALQDHDAQQEPAAQQGPAAHTSGRAIASFLFALLGGGLGAIPALVLGRQARQEIRNSEGRIKGEGWAYWGIALGGVQLAVLGVVALILLVNAASEPSATPRSPNGPLKIAAVNGPVEHVDAEKRGENVYITFTLITDSPYCRFHIDSPGGGHDGQAGPLDAGINYEVFRAPFATGPVRIGCF